MEIDGIGLEMMGVNGNEWKLLGVDANRWEYELVQPKLILLEV